MRAIWLAACSFLVATCAASEAAEDRPEVPKPVKVDSDNWTDVIVETDHPALVYFRGPNSSTKDEEMLKQLEALAVKHAGISTVAVVECGDMGKGSQACRDASIATAPSIKVYAAHKKRNPYTKSWWKESADYEGGPTARAMSMALQSQLVDASIARVRSLADWEDWVGQDPLPKVIVFSDKEKVSLLVKGLAMHFSERLAFAVVDSTVVELADEFHVTQVPAVRVRRASGDVEDYRGGINAVEMRDWLAKFAPERVVDEVNRKNLEDEVPILEHAPKYQNVTAAQLAPLLDTNEDVWLLFFAGKGALEAGCPDSSAAFAAALSHAGDMFRIGVVTLDGAESAAAAPFMDADQLPDGECGLQLRLKPYGDARDAGDLETYDGAIGDRALLETVYELLPDLTTHMSADAVAGFLGIQPGGNSPFTPKIVLGTKKDSAPGLYRALAVNFRRRALEFGWYSSALDPGVAGQFNAPKLPTVMVTFVDPDAAPDASGQVPLGMQVFPMAMKYVYLENFVETIVDRYDLQSGKAGDEDDDDGAADARMGTGPVPQMQSDADLDAACTQRGGACLIALLDAGDSASLASHLDSLQSIRSTRRGQPIHFMWVDVSTQRAFVAALGLDPSEAPTVVLASPKKKRIARLPSRFTRDAVTQLIDRLLNGQVATRPLDVLPALVEGGEAAEEAEEAAPVEEEFDLSDIMDEAVGTLDNRAAKLQAATQEVEQEAAAAKKRAAEEAEAEAAKAKSKKKKKKKKGKKAKKASSGHDEL